MDTSKRDFTTMKWIMLNPPSLPWKQVRYNLCLTDTSALLKRELGTLEQLDCSYTLYLEVPCTLPTLSCFLVDISETPALNIYVPLNVLCNTFIEQQNLN